LDFFAKDFDIQEVQEAKFRGVTSKKEQKRGIQQEMTQAQGFRVGSDHPNALEALD
jgi:hypothetical protein